MGMDWCSDRLHSVVLEVQRADRLWDRQCFKDADPRVTEEINRSLRLAKARIEETLELIEYWGT